MLIESTKLFFQGKLFKNNKKVISLFLIGLLIGSATFVVVGKIFGFVVGAIVGGMITGVLQPILFKNLKAH